jgi:hypothetical protein
MTPDPVERLLGSLDRPMPPREAFAEALLERLLQELDSGADGAAEAEPGKKEAQMTDVLTPRSLVQPVVPWRTARERPTPHHPLLAQVATAALVLLTLLSSFVAFGGTLRQRWDERPASISAVGTPTAVVTPTAVDGITGVRVTMTASWKQPGGWVGLTRAMFAPGGHTKEASPASPQLFAVEDGALTIRSVAGDPPMLAPVAGGQTPPSATPSLSGALPVGAGDAVILPMGSTITIDNERDAPAAILWLVSHPSNSFDLEGRGTSYDYLAMPPIVAMPPAPLTVTLDQIVLGPGESFPAPTTARFAVGAVDAAQLDKVRTPSGLSFLNHAAAPISIYVLTVSPVSAGTPVAGTPTG